ncbi:hypothetical protein [Myxococcus faecalis]|uniref:hypothetical protein n=1 Tax=Myxococcus faecalis TaxID=3115646 RepID=UPI003CF9CAE5
MRPWTPFASLAICVEQRLSQRTPLLLTNKRSKTPNPPAVDNTAAQLDLAKVQMFYFTLIAAVSYFVSLATLLASSKPGSVSSLPALSQGFIALLAISHGGYLVSKTTDHSNSKPA